MKHTCFLSPRTGTTFRKIFFWNPEVTVCFLNAILPFENPQEEEIEECLEFFSLACPSACIPLPCGPIGVIYRDRKGETAAVDICLWVAARTCSRETIAETARSRAVRIAGKYGTAVKKIISLNLTDSSPLVFEECNNDSILPDLPLKMIFIDLSGAKSGTYFQPSDKLLWLHFLRDTGADGTEIDVDTVTSPEVRQALSLLDSSAYSSEELREYTLFLDKTRAAGTAADSIFRNGFDQGYAKGFEEGFDRWYREGVGSGITAGTRQQQRESAGRMKAEGVPEEDIIRWTGIRKYELELL